MSIDYSAFNYGEIDQLDGPPRHSLTVLLTVFSVTVAAVTIAMYLGLGPSMDRIGQPETPVAIGASASSS